jgi:hypothetical protein
MLKNPEEFPPKKISLFVLAKLGQVQLLPPLFEKMGILVGQINTCLCFATSF